MQTIQTGRARHWNLTKVNLWFDLAILVAALCAPAVFFTGLTVHEWLGIGLGVAIMTHLLLHWQWIVQITRRLLGKVPWSARLNYVVNCLFFVDMTLIIFTGIMISEQALPLFGIEMPRNMTWRQVHFLASDFMVFILAAHVALHWKWILNTANRYMLQPLLRPARRLAPVSKPVAMNKEGVA